MGRILRRVLLGAALLTSAAGVGWYVYGRSLWSRFEAKVEALRAAGQPTRFEDLATPPIPDEENGAKLLEEASRILKEREKAPDSAERLLWKDRHDDEDRIAIAAYLDSLLPYFGLLERIPGLAGWRPEFAWSEGAAMMPGPIPELYDAQRLLIARVEFRLEQGGRTERAAATAVLLLELGRKCRGPFVMGHFVSLHFTAGAVEVLRKAMREPGFDPTTFRRIVDPRLADAIPTRGPARSMFIEERVFLIAILRVMDEGGLSRLSGGFYEDPMFPFLHRPRLSRNACSCLDLTEEAIRRSDTTPEDALAVSRDFGAKRQARARKDVVADHANLYMSLFERYAGRVAGFRLARVVMALLEHRQQKGAWPESLDALGAMPLDPYSGKPFRYERTEHGCKVRSAKEDTPENLEEHRLLWTLEDDQIPAMPR